MIFQITLPEESAIHKWKKLKLIISVFRGKRHFFFESNAKGEPSRKTTLCFYTNVWIALKETVTGERIYFEYLTTGI